MAKLSAMIRRRGKGWNVVLRHNGKRYEYGPRADPLLRDARTRNQVEEWAWRKLDEIKAAIKAEEERARVRAERAAAGVPEPVRFSEALAQFEAEELPTLARGTREAYEDSFKPIRAYFVGEVGDPHIDRIFARDIKAFLSWRRVHRKGGPKGPLSNRTLAKDRAVLHRLFSYAERLEWREGNPVGRVPAPKSDGRDPVLLTDRQYEALIRECDEYDMLRLYVLVLGETGARCESEALWLRWEDVDLEEGFLWIASRRRATREHRTKGGKGRWVPMTARLREAMRDHFARYRLTRPGGRPTPWVFHHVGSRRHAAAGERIRSMRRAFLSAAGRAELPEGLHIHDLRHRRVTTWLADGADVVKVKEAVGHADLRTTMGYTHLAREHLRSLVSERDPAERQETAGLGR